MINAILTRAGALRIGRPDLAGKIVQFDNVAELGLCAEKVYYQNEHIATYLSLSGDEQGLICADVCEQEAA